MRPVLLTVRLRAVVAAILVAAAVVLAAVILKATRTVFADLALAAAIACLVRPGVLWLAKRTRMGVALAAVFIALIVAVGGLVGGEAKAIATGAEALQRTIPDRIEQFQRDHPPSDHLRRFLADDEVARRVRTRIQGIPARFILGTDSPAEGASRLGQILLVASLAAFMVTQLPKSLAALIHRLPAETRSIASSATRAAYRVGGAYVRRTLVLAAGCAIAGTITAGVCGVSGAAVLGLWIGMWALVPTIGIMVGGLPLLGLAAGEGMGRLVIAVIVLTAVLVGGEWIRRRWIERRTLTVGTLLSLLAIMAGLEIARWPGALVALLAMAMVLAGIDEIAHQPSRHADEQAVFGLAPAGEMTVSDSDPQRVAIDIDVRSLVVTAVGVLVLVAAVGFVRSIPQALTRFSIGVLVALALNPLVGITRRKLRVARRAAVALVIGTFVVGVVTFAIFAVPRAVEQTRQLSKQTPHLVAQLDDAPIVGKLTRESHLDDRFRSFLDDLPATLATRDKAIEGAAQSAGESMLAVGWILLVLVGALLDGSVIADRAKLALPPWRRPRAERVGRLVYQAVGRSAAGSAFTALLQGAVVLVIGLAFGVPLSPLLAANAAFWAFVPQIGGFLAGVPLFLVGLSQGLGTGIAVGLLFLAWMLFNNHVLHPVIVGRATHVSPLTSMVAVLVGGALGGFVGAMVAIPVASVIHALASPENLDSGDVSQPAR